MTNRGPTRETRDKPAREFIAAKSRGRNFRSRSRGRKRVPVSKISVDDDTED